MDLSSRVPYLKNVCGIAIDLSAVAVPSFSEGDQPFFDSYLVETNAKSVYYGKRSVRFSESSKSSPAGMYFETTVEIAFPNSDKDRALRIEEFKKAKFLIVQLSGGSALLIGRNDYNQNARPTIKFQSDEQLTVVKFTTTSMFQTGFLPQYNAGLLPHSIPVNLLNAV